MVSSYHRPPDLFVPERSPTFRLCQKLNRATLDLVPKWVDDDVYEESIYQYGLPQWVRHLVDLPQRTDATYSDVMLYHSLSTQDPIRYLEVGVSVGKNFLQMIKGLDNAFLCGLDIESISPVLLKFLDQRSQETWETTPESKRKVASTSTVYASKISENVVQYIAGDVFDEKSWLHLPKGFNLIFSDAFHSGEALIIEWNMMKKYGVFADQFTMFWDDLENMDMLNGFWTICADAKATFTDSEVYFSIQKFDGWLGGNEHKHGVGCLIVRGGPLL